MQSQTFVGHQSPLLTARSMLTDAVNGTPGLFLLEGVPGSGRRALFSHLLETTTPRPLALRLAFTEGEDGLKVLLRLYASLYTSLHDDPSLRTPVLAHLDEQLVSSKDARELWLKAFKEGMDKPRPDTSAQSFQVTIPRQSPYLALQEIIATIATRQPVLLELGDVDHVLSFSFWVFLNVLLERIHAEQLPVMVAVWGEPLTDAARAGVPFSPRQVVLERFRGRLPSTEAKLEPLSAGETAELLTDRLGPHRLPEASLSRLVELAEGSPGLSIALLELLKTQELIAQADDGVWVQSSDGELSLEDILPSLPAAQAGLARQMLQVAAHEGMIFTAAVLAQQLDQDKDTIDDLLDELEDVVEEVVHHDGLQSWLYRFRNPFVRHHYRNDLSETARHELSRGLAELLEKHFVGRSVDYAIKAAQLWRLAGEPRRSVQLVGLATSSERPEVLQMGAEVVKAFSGIEVPAPIYKGLHLTLFEKVATSAPTETLNVLLNDVAAWAQSHKEEDILPWLQLYRARVYQRAGRLNEAMQEAEGAQKAFARQKNAVKEADAFNVQALIALVRGDLGLANDFAARALSRTDFPPMRVQATFVRGMVHKNRGELQQALNTLKETLDLAGRLGLLPLHLDAGLNIAEILMMGGKPDDAAGLLKQLLEVSRQTQQLPRQRAALSLLAKAEASLRDMTSAGEYASQALQLSRQLGVRPFEAADLLDLGIFAFVRGQIDEAAVYLREAEKIARELQDPRLLKEITFHHGMVYSALKDYGHALKAYEEALSLARELKDPRREANVLFNVGGLHLHQQEYARARTSFDQAAPLIEQYGSPDEKKALARAREQLELKIN